jgi:hypothetical protein
MTDVRVVCPECGCLNEKMTEELQAAWAMILRQEVTIKKMREEQRRKPQAHPRYEEAMEILRYWQAQCAPRTKELSGDRLVNCLARLDGGYDKGQLMWAVMGYAKRPYLTRSGRSARGRPTQKRVDARLIFKSAEYVDAGIEIANEEIARQAERVQTGPSGHPQKAAERIQMALGI